MSAAHSRLGDRVEQGAAWRKPSGGRTNLDSVDRVHDCVLLSRAVSVWVLGSSRKQREARRGLAAERTAMPAKAPAIMFWNRLKLGGSDS